MKRWTAAACAAAAVALVAGAASPAAAQYPGVNGWVVADDADGPTAAPCNSGNPFVISMVSAAFSADNRQMAALPFRDGVGYYYDLFVYDLTTCVRHSVGQVAEDSTFSFSPDGRQLAVEQDGDVHVITASTGALVRNLTPNFPSTTEGDPTWDPKGRYIAYTASDGVRRRPATGGPSTLMARGGDHADFSPDGRYLAYINTVGKIDYVDAVSGALVKHTAMQTDDRRLMWSPDGTQFAFAAADVNNSGNDYCVTGTTGSKITSRDYAGGVCVPIAWRRR